MRAAVPVKDGNGDSAPRHGVPACPESVPSKVGWGQAGGDLLREN